MAPVYVSENFTIILYSVVLIINSFLASSYFRHLLITFANSLDPDQDRHVGPDLGPNRLTLMISVPGNFCC